MLELGLMGFGVLLFVAGLSGVQNTLRLLRGGVRVEGTVVRVNSTQRTNSDGHVKIMHSPVYEFEDLNGKTQQVEIGGSTTAPPLGKRLTLTYDPKQPDSAIPADWKQMLFAISFMVGALFMIWFGWTLKSQS